ncbi:Gfo/Idh/MocA family oxidoreductase [Solirubrobacter ginsenosidimutans]|uniref:Gfo/Idh/MocA family oxidoreductase n=1 Tax=Solirubrobacter ginsenosidimutans TaxID=490573 RepID=A0A9X3N1S7_9ACTN|nr:Gfo/Idh/MocA family oxidoreductase [Solirubrobacter ginsenosidimutans]MDA0166924.1 Gfo/Idh/MocA family oxidoreductase [Solirubrobacter ginsenosidimutans]
MTPRTSPLGVVVVGYGYWGPNIVRNVMERPELELIALCERDPAQVRRFEARTPGVPSSDDFDALLADPRVDAVCIATPPRTHYALARKALEAGKHVLVEKPLATAVEDAEALVDLAERKELVLMPGHTFLYSPPVNKIHDLITSGELGEIYFVTSSRMNLGLYQADGVVCDLAPHDLSILLYWLDRRVASVSAAGCTVFDPDVAETAFLTLRFEDGPSANVQVSWLAPRKVRQMIIVGSRKMVQYDDTMPDGAVRIYDRGLDMEVVQEPANFGEHRLTYRSGDIVAPRIDAAEPLSLELADFANSILTGARPRSHSRLGLEIVRVLAAAEASLAGSGEPVVISREGTLVSKAAPLGPDTRAA